MLVTCRQAAAHNTLRIEELLISQHTISRNKIMMFIVCSVFCLTLIALDCADAKILQGQLITDKNWAFLARFCFLTEHGKFGYDLVIGKDSEMKSSMNLLLYYDAPSQWPSVYPSNRTCEDKVSMLPREFGQKVTLSLDNTYARASGCRSINATGVYARCTSYREFRSSRPRWWFIALGDCSSTTGLNITYRLSLTNGPKNSFWRHHFSADEFYILPELIATACAYVVLLALSFYTAIQLRSRRLLHMSYKIFVMSMICQLMGVLCKIYSMVVCALTGMESPRFSLAGGLLEAYSEILFTVLLLLLALGYTVTKSELTHRQIWWFVLFIAASVILQMSLFIYQSEVFDPGLVLYIYESPPGFGLIALKIGTWGVFIICCYGTGRITTTKTRFYAALMSLGSAWFLCHPATVLAVTIFVDKWIRESVAKGCSLSIVLIGHAIFLYVIRPSSENPHFPFHIRTCQVVPAETEQNHSYEPRGRTTASLFTVSQFATSIGARK